jgi:hypothetical protein
MSRTWKGWKWIAVVAGCGLGFAFSTYVGCHGS